MASLLPKGTIPIFLFICFFILAAVGANPTHKHETHRSLKEKMTHLHFYFHDIVSGRNPTAITIAGIQNSTSQTGFGDIVMIDDPLTEGPELTSKLIGRAQGLYASAGLKDLSLLMAVNYVFLEGKYNGSSLSILGRNAAMSPLREMPVVGGSGAFRMARGYALARTRWIDANTGDATVEYNVYVMHY